MNARLFVASNGRGLTRAGRQPDDSWAVDSLLPDQDVRCLAADPFAAGVIYAGTQGQGVLRSGDGGRTWQPWGLAGQIVKTLAPSPAEPGVIYAGTKPPAIYVSRDGGQQWQELASFRRIRGRRFWFSPAEPPFTAYVQAIAVSPSQPELIVAGIEFGAVVRSGDGGRSWSGHRRGALRDCHSLIFHASDGDWAYEAGGTGRGAAVSQDGGQSWRQPKQGLDRHYGWACAADPARPEVWYASLAPQPSLLKPGTPPAHNDGQANAYIFRSSAGGAWEKLGGGLPQPLDYMAYALLTDAAAPGHLYAGLSSGDVWHTADYGDTWRQLPLNLGGIHRTLILV